MTSVPGIYSDTNQEQLKLLFDSMLNGYARCKMLYDQNGAPKDFVYLAVNPAFERLTGLKDVVGKPVSEVIPGFEKTNPEVLALYGRVAMTEKPEMFELHVAQLSIWLELSVYSPEKDHFIVFFENITKYKTVIEQLGTDDERLGLALKASNMGVWDWNMVTGNVYWSSELLSITGKQEFDGTIEAFTSIIHPEDIEKAKAEIQECITSGKEYKTEFRIKHASGRIIWLASLGKIFYDENKKPLRMVGTTMDVTDRKDIFIKLNARTEELELFRKMTVDRELKMIDLKKELKESVEKVKS